MKHDEELMLAQSRADSYALLSRCFFPPDKSLLVTLRAIDAAEDNLWRELIDTARGLDAIDELVMDYARLFVGPYQLLAPPYGSVYMDSGRQVAGASTVSVRKLYRKEGVDVNLKEVPDHVGIELEFMKYLIGEEIASIKRRDSSARGDCGNKQFLFLREYLVCWIPQFSKAVGENSENDFYRSLGGVIETFILNDFALLEDRIE